MEPGALAGFSLAWQPAAEGRHFSQETSMANPHIEMMKQNRAAQKAEQMAELHTIRNLTGLAAIAKHGHESQANAPDPRSDMADMLGKAGSRRNR